MADRSRSLRALFVALASALFVLALATRASAHDVGLSRGEYAIKGAIVSADLTFSRREMVGVVPDLDPDHDGVIAADEIDRARASIAHGVVDRVRVTGDGAACPGSLERAALAEEDGLEIRAVYRCPKPPMKVSIELTLLEELPYGHRHIARAPGPAEAAPPSASAEPQAAGGAGAAGAADAADIERVLFRSNRTLELQGSGKEPTEPSAGAGASASPAPPASAPTPSFVGFFLMGIEHILTGYDHLIFLLGLVLVGGRPRAMLLVITAFTIAHSITLGMAALGVLAPSPRIVEPMIALSIAYVGVENFFVKDAEKRWRITFPFGLVHGFGFAGALGEIRLPRAEVPVALVSFNLGVEAGQLAVLALVLPLILAARKREWFKDQGVKLISGAIIIAGLFWFVTRALGLNLG